MRLFRNPGSLVVGAIAGGIVVAAVVVSLQLLTSGKSHTSKQIEFEGSIVDDAASSPQTNPIEESGSEDYATLLSAARDLNGISALYQTLVRVDQTELIKLLGLSKSIQTPSHRLLVQGAIFQRFAALDPERAIGNVEHIDWQHRDAVLESIYREWSISNLNAAVASLGKLNSKQQTIGLETIIQTRDDLSDSRLRDIARSFKREDLFIRLKNEFQTFEYENDPEAAWNALTKDGFDLVAQLDVATTIAQQWLKQSGFEILPRVIESLRGQMGYDILVGGLVTSATESDPEGFLQYAQTLDEHSRLFVLNRISYVWGSTDPLSAAQAALSLKPNGNMRNNLQMILRQWARSNPHEIYEKRSLFPRDVQLEALQYAIAEMAEANPEEAIHLLEKLQAEWDDTSTLSRSLVNGWAGVDPRAALEWVQGESVRLGPKFLDAIADVLVKFLQHDPEEAFAIALSHPPLPYGDAIEVRLIRELSRDDLDTAVALLPQVRDESRRDAYQYMAYALVDSGQANRALELAQSLPEPEQVNYFNSMLWNWARTNSEELFKNIENLPNDEIKSLAAYSLVNFHSHTPVLTNEQIDHARTYLNEQHLERIRNTP